MSDLKVGYRAVFYAGTEVLGEGRVRDSYNDALKDIKKENESTENLNVVTFTHAKVEKVYFRNKMSY